MKYWSIALGLVFTPLLFYYAPRYVYIVRAIEILKPNIALKIKGF